MSGLGIDEGFLRRLRATEPAIAWRAARGGKPRTGERIAHLHDEEARVRAEERAGAMTLEVTSGPVGAALLLLEADRRGPPSFLGGRNAGASAGFPDGSIVAAWGPAGELAADSRPTLRDLVELARYALR